MNNFRDFAKELKKHEGDGVFVVGALKTLKKDWEIRRIFETIQTTALLRSARILRRVLKTRGDLLSGKKHLLKLIFSS